MVTETAVIKGGAMLATGSMIAEMIIFNDPMYKYLAIVGAVVSASGVFHELTTDGKCYTLKIVLSEVLKGIMLGFLAIPFWYLALSGLGDTILAKQFGIESAKMEKSLWLMIAFGMSWYTVPVYNWIVQKVTFRAKKSIDEDI